MIAATGERPRIAILASGSGTTAEFVIHATRTPVLAAEVGLVICNNGEEKAEIYSRVERLNQQYGLSIPVKHISGVTEKDGVKGAREMSDREAERIYQECKGFDLTVLLGYMKRVRGAALKLPMINTHPGPLPQTAGCMGDDAQKRVLELGLPYSAQTLHWVNEEYDMGQVIAEHRVPVLQGDDYDKLFKAVQATEKSWVPIDLGRVLHAGLPALQ